MKKLAVVLCLCAALFSGCGNTQKSAENSADTAKSSSADGIDIDLTKMSSTMVYSTVYSMITTPDDYMGKKIRVTGNFNAYHSENTDKTYFSVIIADATACCQQGLEFIWDDGSHVFPDEYPEDGSDAIVTGVFETYKDNPDDVYEYIRLKDASFEVVKNAEEVSE